MFLIIFKHSVIDAIFLATRRIYNDSFINSMYIHTHLTSFWLGSNGYM